MIKLLVTNARPTQKPSSSIFRNIAATESNFEKSIKESNDGIKEFQINNTGIESQISNNNTELKTIYDKIFEIEKEMKQLQSDKYVINFKNKNLQEKIKENNQNQKKIDTDLKIQEERYRKFKTTLSK